MLLQPADLLHQGGHSLVLRNGEVRTYGRRGVADVLDVLLHDAAFLRGASAADKVVGKGAAALFILGGVKELHADVISKPALCLLQTAPIGLSYGKVVPNIINRRGDSICPVERLCLTCRTAAECLPLIREFYDSMSNDK